MVTCGVFLDVPANCYAFIRLPPNLIERVDLCCGKSQPCWWL